MDKITKLPKWLSIPLIIVLAPILLIVGPILLTFCLVAQRFDPMRRKGIGRLTAIPPVHPHLLQSFKDDRLSLPKLLNFHEAITVLVAFLIAASPFVSQIQENQMLIFVLPLIALLSLAMIYRGIAHIVSYDRWLRVFGDTIVKQLRTLKDSSKEDYLNVLTMISKGETRKLLLGYPEIYIKLQVPHLWNSLDGTKLSVLSSLLILLTTLILLGKLTCGVPGEFSPLRSCLTLFSR